MASSSAFSGAIILGDGQGNVYFASTDGVAQPRTAALMYGTLTAAPACQSNLAFLGEGNTQGESILHAYNVNSGNDLWAQNPIQISASFDASPVISTDSVLYVAGSNGYLYAYDVTTPAAPVQLWALNVLQLPANSTQRITANLLSNDESEIYLVSASGIYGVQLTGRTTPGIPAWRAGAGVSFTQGTAFLNNTTIVAVAGSSLYGFDTTATVTAGTLPSAWQYVSPQPLYTPQNLDCVHVMVGDAGGTFHVVDMTSGAQVGTIASGLPAAAVQNSTTYNGLQLVSVSGSSQISVFEIHVTQDFGCWFTPAYAPVSLPGVTLTGAPFVANGAIYVAATSGSLYALALATGVQFWSQSLASQLAGVGPSMFVPILAESSAAVRFLMDGNDYFVTMKNLLIAAKNGSLSDGANPPSPPTFENLVQAVATAGFKTYVLMWDATALNYMQEEGDLMAAAATVIFHESALHRFVNRKTECNLEFDNVNVYLEPYPFAALGSLNFGRLLYGNAGVMAQHQKIAIFNVNGTKLALVSGLNIGPPDWDLSTHPMTDVDANQKNTYLARHDTAVLLQGPAVDLVEQEFDRRWMKSGQSSVNPGTPTYVKVACWAIHHDMCLDVPGVCKGTVAPTPFSNPALTSPQVPVSVLITNADDPNVFIREIQDELTEQIGQAQQYMYFENFTLQAPSLVEALARRLTTPGNTCRLIVMLPSPPVGEEVQGPMIRAAYALLLILTGQWTQLTYNSYPTGTMINIDSTLYGPAQVVGDGPQQVTIQASQVTGLTPFYKSSLYETTISYTNTTTNQTGWFKLRDIVSLTTPAPTSSSKVVFSTPARYFATPQTGNTASVPQGWPPNYRAIYIHSKLALFDDSVAVIGSANFNGRSLQMDGEMSVLVNDAATVTGIRTTLFQHWGMTTPANWVADMNTFATAPTPGVGVLPYRFEILPTLFPRKYQRLFFDFVGLDPSLVL